MNKSDPINNFLNREALEKANLDRQFAFGKFFDLKWLRECQVGRLRSRAYRLTNCGVMHVANGDEAKFQNDSFVGSFTKGLPHADTGLIDDAEQFKRFRVATHTGDFFSDTVLQLGKRPDAAWRAVIIVDKNKDRPIRGWESPSSGLTYEMHGPDSHSVTMPPAPALGSEELTFEMAEVYWLALLRDKPFTEFQIGGGDQTVTDAVDHLNALPWIQNGMPTAPGLERRKRQLQGGQLNKQTIFRGATPGDLAGPFLSQFLLIGTPGHEGDQTNIENGLIGYGALKVDQKLKPAVANLDHMTSWNVFLDVQDAANVKNTDQFDPNSRFITTPRDLATYVHFDALYEAYLNACLILLGLGAPVDLGIQQLNDLFSAKAKSASAVDLGRVDGFALFGGPHVLNLVTEVATRALKAVRYQKFNIHCRLRPEALAGWMEAINQGEPQVANISELKQTYDVLNTTYGGSNLLELIRQHNDQQNNSTLNAQLDYLQPNALQGGNTKTALLPMAFPEGSPMHPAYGAGHATVAGACVTMLKAFFDTSAVLGRDPKGNVKITSREAFDEGNCKPVAYVSKGNELDDQADTLIEKPLTVGDELNKIAANISIGRDMAGVHYYTDYIDSLVMGEKVALGILLEQSLAYETYPDKVRPSFRLTTFLGRTLKIKDGRIMEGNLDINWCDL